METKKAQNNQEESKETQTTAIAETTTIDQKAIRKEKIKRIGILAGIGTALVGAGLLLGKVIFGGSAGSEDGMDPIVTDFVDEEPSNEE